MKVIFVFLVLSLLLVSGCTVNTTTPTVTVTTTTTSMLITPYLVYVPISNNATEETSEIAHPTLVPCEYDYFWVGQDKITLSNMYLGATADTWKSDMKMVNGYKYKEGEPLCFTIYNNSTFDHEYAIELDNGYYGQPPSYTNWVTISTLHPIVPPRTAMNIPVRLQIPASVNEAINHQWEFRVGVILIGTGNVQYASWVRFIVVMR